MIGGAVIVGLCLLVLGWTSEIVEMFVVEEKSVSRPKSKCSQID